MNTLLPIVIFTANILGIFTDPFEFEGDYGPESNSTRAKVFELVVKKEVPPDYGPTFSQLITPQLIAEIKKKQIPKSDLEAILNFIENNKDQKVFYYLNNHPNLLSLDKVLRDKAAREGKIFDLPILGSTKTLEGKNSDELKKNLIDAIFTQENFSQASSDQIFYYWVYQALNLHLISSNPEMIERVNKVKEEFARTLGDSTARANTFKKKLIDANAEVLFTQECDNILIQVLTKDGLFLPIDRQNQLDGTLVFLKSDEWEPDYQIVPIDGYPGGQMNVILATRKGTSQQFLLAACHGHSTKSEDGRKQISLIMEKFHQLSDGNLQLFIGTDANTKTEEDVRLFVEHIDKLGLISTQTGPTTVKRRMLTAQHSKTGKLSIDQEDYLITLKGGRYKFEHVTVGFKEGPVDINKTLPNMDNPSDHYPVGATMTPISREVLMVLSQILEKSRVPDHFLQR